MQKITGNLKAKLSDTVFRLAKSLAQALDKITTTTLKTQYIPEQVPCELLIASEGVISKVFISSVLVIFNSKSDTGILGRSP